MEPTFGSKLYTLIDKRPDETWRLLFIRYTFEAVEMWEPRVKLQKVTPKVVGNKTIIGLQFLVLEANEIVEKEVVYD